MNSDELKGTPEGVLKGANTCVGISDEAQERKDTPIFSGVLMYFPKAMSALAKCSKKGNDQHNPGKALHWDRAKSGDELDALTRHLMEAGTVDTDGIRHSTKTAWRALANLEKELERAEEVLRIINDDAIEKSFSALERTVSAHEAGGWSGINGI